jgi:hypothetical protein
MDTAATKVCMRSDRAQWNSLFLALPTLAITLAATEQKTDPSPGHATSSGLQPGANHSGGWQYCVRIVWCRVHWQLHFQPDSLLHARSVVRGILDTRH